MLKYAVWPSLLMILTTFMWVCLSDNGTTLYDGCEISCHLVAMEQWSIINQMFVVEGVFQE